MGSKSASKSATTSTTQYTTTTQNLNLQGIEGIAVAGNDGDVSLTLTDAGAVAGALGLGETAIESAESVAERAISSGEYLAGLYQGALGSSFAEALGFADRVVTESQAALDRQVGASISAIARLAEGQQQGEAALWTRIAGWGLIGLIAITAIVRFTK